MNRAILLTVVAELGLLLAVGGEAPARLPQGLVGTWLHRTRETEIRVELRADGRYARVVREDEDTERDAGRFRENDDRLRRIYFGAEPNDTQIPPEAGYYVGYLLIEALAKDRPLAELARLDPKAVYPLVEAQLARLADAR